MDGGAWQSGTVVAISGSGSHGLEYYSRDVAVNVEGSQTVSEVCRIDVEADAAAVPVVVPGFDRRMPDGVFVRGVPGGSLDEVVFYLDVLHALQSLGVPVYNDARAIERTVDKGMTSFLLRQARVATPPAWIVPLPAQAPALR